jgi:hypothetical protein
VTSSYQTWMTTPSSSKANRAPATSATLHQSM